MTPDHLFAQTDWFKLGATAKLAGSTRYDILYK
jgi:hypothetical protein